MKKTKKIKRKNLTVNIVALVTVFLLMASAAMVPTDPHSSTLHPSRSGSPAIRGLSR